MRPFPVAFALFLLPSCIQGGVETTYDLSTDADPRERLAPPVERTPAFEAAPNESPRLRALVSEDVVEYALKRAELEGDARRLAITLDRPLYRPGETIWARVWDLTADTLDSAMEDDVFLTLLDARGVVVSKQRLAAKHCDHSDGCSEGQGERPGGM